MEKRDYYEILGVARNAGENEIKKALAEGKRIAVLDKDGRLIIKKPEGQEPEAEKPAEAPAAPAEQTDTTDDNAPEENKE